MPTKTAAGLVAYARAQRGKPYWYACFGNKPTHELLEYKVRQYPELWRPSSRITRAKTQHIGRFDRVHDCIGLIKGYLWSDTLTSAPKYNAAQDKNANGMRALSNAKSIGTIPEEPGVLVFLDGHVGVYIGKGQVIEARGSDYGVVQTALKSRPWTSWGRCPWIEYAAAKPVAAKPLAIEAFKKGDTILLNGPVFRDSYGAGQGRTFTNHRDKVVSVAPVNRAAPYLIGEIGWVKAKDLTKV